MKKARAVNEGKRQGYKEKVNKRDKKRGRDKGKACDQVRCEEPEDGKDWEDGRKIRQENMLLQAEIHYENK